jgi:hypothetical protein
VRSRVSRCRLPCLPKESAPDEREVRGRVSQDFALVDQVAHAFKHVVTGARGSSDRLNAEEVISRPAAYWGSGVWDLSSWSDPIGGVTLDSDRSVDVLATVKRAVEFFRDAP